MISFANDYSETCHPRILELLLSLQDEQNPGYGLDRHSEAARKTIARRLETKNADIHFIPGGTQTNLLAISSLLRPHEGVLAVSSGHICVHESGAIEATGHKVLSIPSEDGKMRPRDIESVCRAHYEDATHEHMVKPGMVYISNTTEVGTLYSREELTALHKTAREYGLPIYIDGARLASALAAEEAGLAFSDMPKLCEAFSIGGTKNGLLFGEAMVLLHEPWKKDFRYIQKQKGAMLAKGWLLGAQFEAVFRDDLYFEMGSHCNEMAALLRSGLERHGARFVWAPQSNQIFIRLREETIEKLARNFIFEVTPQAEDDPIARFCTSWATKPSAVNALIEAISELPENSLR